MQIRQHASVLILLAAVVMLADGLIRNPSLHQRGGSLQLPSPSPSSLYSSSTLVPDDETTPDFQRVASAISLVSGTTVGAGILALASVSQKPGFVPSAICLIGTWILMASTGLLIAEVTCNIRSGRNTATLSHEAATGEEEVVKTDFGLVT